MDLVGAFNPVRCGKTHICCLYDVSILFKPWKQKLN